MGKPKKPIVKDYDQMASSVARLFEVRHILCHELPSESVYEKAEIGLLLREAYCFVCSLEEILQFEKFGAAPLTQSAMNADAADTLRKLEEKLDALVSTIRNAIKRSEVDSKDRRGLNNESWEESFEEDQRAWKSYRDSHCSFVTYSHSGGSIRPLIWANEAVLTDQRPDRKSPSLG